MNPNSRHFATTYYLPTSQGGDVQRALCFTGRNGYLEHLLTNDRSVVGCPKCLARMPQQTKTSGDCNMARREPLHVVRGTFWTDDRRATAKRLWLEGCSAGEIAKTLGGVTRNAVIGIITRAGLKRPQAARDASISLGASLGRRTIAQRPRLVRLDANAKPRPEARVFGETKVAKPGQRLAIAGNGGVYETAPDVPTPSRMEPAGLATMETLGRCMCKWPIGDPLQPGFTFCGRKTSETYCGVHAPIAYQPATTTKRKDPGADLARALRRYV